MNWMSNGIFFVYNNWFSRLLILKLNVNLLVIILIEGIDVTNLFQNKLAVFISLFSYFNNNTIIARI